MEVWSLILKSNLFNFSIMIVILAFVVKKLDLCQKLDDAIAKVKEKIEESELANKNSEQELKEAGEKTKNVQQEIEQIEQKGNENISNLEQKIAQEAQDEVDSIKTNADKLINAKEKEIASCLSKKTILASVEIAKKHVINLLKQNPDYHRKFIKESIEELNRLS